MYNVHGSFDCDDPDLMFELSDKLKIQNIASVEGYFKGTMYHTPGRWAADPLDSYPDEYEDDRFLEELTICCTDGTSHDFSCSDFELLQLAQEVLDPVIYDTEVSSMYEREEPYVDL